MKATTKQLASDMSAALTSSVLGEASSKKMTKAIDKTAKKLSKKVVKIKKNQSK